MPINEAETPPIDVETVLTVALKLFALYLIFTAVLSSGYLMSLLLNIATTVLSSGSLNGVSWMNAGTVIASTGLAIGFAVILLRHGNRAAHWLGVRSGATLPALSPTKRWYRASIAFVGVYILATQAAMVLSQVVRVIGVWFGATDAFNTPAARISSVILAVAIPVAGCVLILRSQRIGDWLYRVSNPEPDPEDAA